MGLGVLSGLPSSRTSLVHEPPPSRGGQENESRFRAGFGFGFLGWVQVQGALGGWFRVGFGVRSRLA